MADRWQSPSLNLVWLPSLLTMAPDQLSVFFRQLHPSHQSDILREIHELEQFFVINSMPAVEKLSDAMGELIDMLRDGDTPEWKPS